jgi:hypothetical protein
MFYPAFLVQAFKVKLLEKVLVFLAETWSTLEANISGSVWILFSLYIIIRKDFSQLFNDVSEIIVGYLAFELWSEV